MNNYKQLGKKSTGKKVILMHFQKTANVRAEVMCSRLLQRWLPARENT